MTLFTKREAAKMLRVCLRTVDRLVARGQLRLTRIGRRHFLRERELQRFLDRVTK